MIPPPPPPPPPPPTFFQSYHRPQQQKSSEKFLHHHRSGSITHLHTSSEFDSSKLQKLSASQKCLTLEYKQQIRQSSNGDLRRSGRPRSSHNLNNIANSNKHESSTTIMQNGHSKSKIYQQNHENHHNYSSKYNRNYCSNASLMRQKSDQSVNSDTKYSASQQSNNHKADQLSIFDGSKKSRCILFSQIYLITHVSITICLSKLRDVPLNSNEYSSFSKDVIIDVYSLYILLSSLIYFALLRYYAVPRFTDNLTFNELTEQTPILFGAIILGFSELAQCVMEVIECVESDSFIIPAVKFLYYAAFMHFLLTQIIYNDYIGLRNIAIAHLLSTQISLWILSSSYQENLQQQKHYCDHKLDFGIMKRFLFNHNITSDQLMEFRNDFYNSENAELPEPFQISLHVLNNQFKFLSVFILITMWFSNNQSKINFIRAKLSEEEVIRSSYLNPESKQYLFRGFVVGSIFLMTAVITIIFYDNRILQYCSSIFIQIMIAIISLTGLVIRRHRIDSNDPKYQINILKHHFIIFVTLFLVYVVSLMNLVTFLTRIMTNEDRSNEILDHNKQLSFLLSAVCYLTLIIQVTLQSYLLRLQGKKLVNMTHVFSLLAIANFALWMIDVSTIVTDRNLWPIHWLIPSSNLSGNDFENVSTIEFTTENNYNSLAVTYNDNYLRNVFTMFVPLNRFYCSLIFFHFWKLKI